MDMGDKDKFELEKRNDNHMDFHSTSSIPSGWQFHAATNSSMSLVPPACRGDLGGSSCSSASVVDTFGPAMWEQATSSQNLGYCDISVQNNASNSSRIEIGKAGAASFRGGIDRPMDMGWNPPHSVVKGGVFLPNVPGMLPQSLSQFPADSAFIERAARFSCFSGGNFGDMINPFAIPESMGLYSRGGGMLQPQEVFTSSGLKSLSGGQAQQNHVNVGEASREASLSVPHGATEGSPLKNEKRSESVARSHDEAKQGVGESGNESDEAEFSGGCGQDEQSMLEGNDADISAKSPGSKKRKRGGQETERDQAKGTPKSGEATNDNVEIQQKGDQKPNSTTTKAAGKQSKQGSQASDPPKEEYIHVRARRGQATNSHSLAERVRREKISERMKFLQDLVPGCSKVTGKAVMLDEIINYVQSLQRQVEFLSMKLATVNPRLDFNIEGLLAKDVSGFELTLPLAQILQSRSVPSSLAFAPEMPMAYPPLHPSQPGLVPAAFPGMESHSDILRRTINTQLTNMTGGFKEPAQVSSAWDDELHNVVQMSYGSGPPQDSPDVNGIKVRSMPPGHLKVEL
ncbi:hypothetical protein Tsubulata_031542 [Turnera subulata]|uniref:BHLH domain-containing protein n=1 Tax=Turnera subulata TaxID=218843 RepID=A0A9Q0J477_9ROSI|nr:hypothetical protein Tsubulata_031542 [Turnera subulata]